MMRCAQPPTGRAAAHAAALANHLPALRTARLRLRAPRVEDFATFAEITCGPRGTFLGGPTTRDRAWYDFANMVGAWLLHGHGLWTIEPADGGAPLGFVVIGLEPGDAAPELGFMLTEAAEGQGFATEAAAAARSFALDELALPELVSYIDRDNARSIALAERLGATRTDAGGANYVYVHTKGAA